LIPEEELELSRERYRRLFNKSLQGITIFANGRIILANPAYAETLGRSLDELLEMSADEVWTLVHPDDKPELEERNKLLNSVKSLPKHRFRYIRPSGEIRWVDSYANIIEHDGTRTMQALEVDITEQVKAERALRENEERFRTFVESSEHGFIVFQGSPPRVIYANPSLSTLTGFTSHELMSMPIVDIVNLIDEGFRDQASAYIETALHRGEKLDIFNEFQFRRKDGAQIWLRTDSSIITLNNKPALQMLVSDITERFETQEIVKKNEERYRTLFESANDAIFLMNYDVFLECNDRTLEMYGCTRKQILGSTPYRFSPQFQQDGRTSKEAAIERIQAALDGTPQSFEWKHTKFDGTTFDAEIGLNAIQLGKEVFIQAIVRDVTKRKELEQKTRSASRRGLLFLDLLTHDVKNKLQALELFTGLIAEKEASDEDVLRMVSDSIGECNQLISKVETTKALPNIPLERHRLQEVLLRCVNKISLENRDVEVLLPHIAIKNGHVLADEYIDLIFYELMENGIRHNKNENKKIWILVDESELSYDVSIADNGQGLSSSMREEIFNPEKRTGGVGLHLVHEIVEKYNGTVRVLDRIEGQPSSGTMFVISFPKIVDVHEAS
jgi:PAS domain S-box-containing protein